MKVRALFSSIGNSIQARWNKPSGRSAGRTVTPADVPPVHQSPQQPFSQKTLDRWKVTAATGQPLINFQGKKLKSDQLSEFRKELINHYKDDYENHDILSSKVDLLLIEMGLAKGDPGELRPTGWFSSAKLNTQHLETLDRYLSITNPVSCGKQMLKDDIKLGKDYIFYFLIVSSLGTQNPHIQDLIDSGLAIEQESESGGRVHPAEIVVTMAHLDALETAESRQTHQEEEDKDQQTKQKQPTSNAFTKLCPIIITPDNFMETCLELEQALPEKDRYEILSFMANPNYEAAINIGKIDSIASHDGLPETLSSLSLCYQAGLKLNEQLKATPKPANQQQYFKILDSLSQSSIVPEIKQTVSMLRHEVENGQLTADRYQNYLLILSIAMPSQTALLGTISKSLDTSWLEHKPSSPLKESSWSASFHSDVNAIRSQADQQMEEKPGHTSRISAYLTDLHQDAANDAQYDKALTRLYNTISSVKKGMKSSKVSPDMKNWLLEKLPAVQSSLADQCVKRLPHSLSYMINQPLNGADLGAGTVLKDQWKKATETVEAEALNSPQKATLSFSGTASLNSPDSGIEILPATAALNSYKLGRFTGSRTAGKTLSHFLKNSLTNYAHELEQHRLSAVTPLQLSPDLNSAATEMKYSISVLPSGDYKIQQIYTTPKPLYDFDHESKGQLEFQEYKVAIETVINKRKLLLGKIEASEPTVNVSTVIDQYGQ